MTSTHAARKRKAHPYPQRTRPRPWTQTGIHYNQSKETKYQPPDKGPSTLLTAKNKNSL